MDEFITSIMQTLKTNGFPEKRVSLPTEKMYEAADKRNLSFNKVLETMKTDFKIHADIGTDKIVFSEEKAETAMSKEDMMKQAQEMMAQMDPEELRKIQEAFMSMSPEQKEEIMKKGKDMGIL